MSGDGVKRISATQQIQRLSVGALWILYVAPALAMSGWAWTNRSPRAAEALLITFLILGVVIAEIARNWRTFFLVQYPVCLLGVAYAAYALAFGKPPGTILAGIVVGASLEELRGFIATTQGLSLAYLLTGWTVCYLTAAFVAPAGRIFDRGRPLARRIGILLLIPASAYAATAPTQLIDGFILEPVTGGLKFLFVDVPQYKSDLRLAEKHKVPYKAQRSGGEEVHILVIGESTRRASWSVYGYGRPTTPYLEAHRNETVFLQKGIADANFTLRSVPMMLTGMNPEDFEIAKVRGNLFDLAQEAGYESILLSNQDFGPAEAAGVGPDLIEAPIDINAVDWDRHTLDAQLLPAFRREMARNGKARFIGVHVMGSHSLYLNRYPEAFSRFGSIDQLRALSNGTIFLPEKETEAVIVDSYDNSVLYTDWLLGQIIEKARELSVPATVTFFGDHGESLLLLDGQAGHGQPAYTPSVFEVPAFVWMNDAYRELHPEIVIALNDNAAKEIRSHNVFYAMAEIMGIQYPEASAARSFASNRFIPDIAMKHIAGAALVSRPQDPLVAPASRIDTRELAAAQ